MITKEQALTPIIEADSDWDSEGVANISFIAKRCNTTKYQAKKQIKILLEEGLIVQAIRKGGFDEYSCEPYPPLRGYKITQKAKELELYKRLKAIEEERFKKCFGLLE